MIPKFRFWYEREDFYRDENYMRGVWKIEYITNSKIKLNDDYIFNPYTNVAENIYANTKIYLMQSTGLKDKNGVEIFEGDIVKVIDLNYRIEVISEVVWGMDSNVYGNYPAFAIQDFESESNSFSEIFDSGCYRIKVIGNIYENQELLEEHNASK